MVQGFFVQNSVLLLCKLIILGWPYNVVVGVSHHIYTYINIYSILSLSSFLKLWFLWKFVSLKFDLTAFGGGGA